MAYLVNKVYSEIIVDKATYLVKKINMTVDMTVRECNTTGDHKNIKETVTVVYDNYGNNGVIGDPEDGPLRAHFVLSMIKRL